MTNFRQILPVTLLGLSAGFGANQAQQKGDLEKRVTALEEQLEEMQTYFKAQAKSAGEFKQALDASEQAGFTYGINPESRKVLLKGMRAFSDSVIKGAPGAKGAKGEEKKTAQR